MESNYYRNNSNQYNTSQDNMFQNNMNMDNRNQGGMNMDDMDMDDMNMGGMNQGGMNQGGMNQGGMNQGGMNQGGMNQGGINMGQNQMTDYGPRPVIFNIERVSEQNSNFRTAIWTGTYLQLTVMSINPGGEIGAEVHNNLDQFLRVEEGTGIAKMGASEDALNFQVPVNDDYAIIVPAGTWHNLVNTGNSPLKVYSIYAPPQHPKGTVHRTKAESDAAE